MTKDSASSPEVRLISAAENLAAAWKSGSIYLSEAGLHGGSPYSELLEAAKAILTPVPMLLWCPSCGDRHIDVGEFATKVHHTHACQSCGMVWRPAVVATVGVQWLPGFKNER